MKKWQQALCLSLAVMILFSSAAHAHSAPEHWTDMSRALFGCENFGIGKPSEVREAFVMIKYASQLCIDQFGKDAGKAYLQRLHKQRIAGMPDKISEIALYPMHNDHRAYTHLGWEYQYSNDSRNPDWSTERWPRRQKIMLATVECIFDFNSIPNFIDPSSWLGSDQRCICFCELIYYIHILGDHIEYNYITYNKGKDQVMPIASVRGDNVISEIIATFPVLFSDSDYSELQNELNAISSKLISILNDPDNMRTEEGFKLYHEQAEKVLEKLEQHLPRLLKSEPFFYNVFYQ